MLVLQGQYNDVAYCQHMLGFYYCFNNCVEREIEWQTYGSVSQRVEDYVGSPFSCDQYGLSNDVDG
jgi:hypothetical protein